METSQAINTQLPWTEFLDLYLEGKAVWLKVYQPLSTFTWLLSRYFSMKQLRPVLESIRMLCTHTTKTK